MTEQSQISKDRELLERWNKERLLPNLGQAPAAIDALLTAQDRISREEERERAAPCIFTCPECKVLTDAYNQQDHSFYLSSSNPTTP